MTDKVRVLITGWDNFHDYPLFCKKLREKLFKKRLSLPNITLYTTERCKGVAKLSQWWAHQRFVPLIGMQHSQALREADLVIAFWDKRDKRTKEELRELKRLRRHVALITIDNTLSGGNDDDKY